MKVPVLTAITLLICSVAFATDQNIIELNGPQGEVILLRELTSLVVPSHAPRNRVCVAPNGEQAEVLGQVASEDYPIVWLNIKVITGICAGEIGWINSESAQKH